MSATPNCHTRPSHPSGPPAAPERPSLYPHHPSKQASERAAIPMNSPTTGATTESPESTRWRWLNGGKMCVGVGVGEGVCVCVFVSLSLCVRAEAAHRSAAG
eukprot:795724-Prorocentrum_minimum.AAC.1